MYVYIYIHIYIYIATVLALMRSRSRSPAPPPPPPPIPPDDPPEGDDWVPYYCDLCEMWIRLGQYRDHVRKRRHVRKKEAWWQANLEGWQ